MNRLLCGLKMSGKTTIGKLLAQKLQLPFLDTDQLIENAYGEMTGKKSSCRQIFSEEGETYFRALEKEQIKALQGMDHTVISLGGGALNAPDNVKILQGAGLMIYLKAPVEILWKRILEKGIPPYLNPLDPERSFYALAEKSTYLYEQTAHMVIETASLHEQEIVAKIINQKEAIHGK